MDTMRKACIAAIQKKPGASGEPDPELIETVRYVVDKYLAVTDQSGPEELAQRTARSVRSLFGNVDNLAAACFHLAMDYDERGFPEEAVFYYRLSVIIEPAVKAYNNLAALYAVMGENKDAIGVLREGLSLFSDDAMMIENYALLRERSHTG